MRKTLGMTDEQINERLDYSEDRVQLAMDDHSKECFIDHMACIEQYRHLKYNKLLSTINAMLHKELSRRITADTAAGDAPCITLGNPQQ